MDLVWYYVLPGKLYSLTKIQPWLQSFLLLPDIGTVNIKIYHFLMKQKGCLNCHSFVWSIYKKNFTWWGQGCFFVQVTQFLRLVLRSIIAVLFPEFTLVVLHILNFTLIKQMHPYKRNFLLLCFVYFHFKIEYVHSG